MAKRIVFQTQTETWESLSCKELGKKETREFFHELLDEWLDHMEETPEVEEEDDTRDLKYRRLLFQPCTTNHDH